MKADKIIILATIGLFSSGKPILAQLPPPEEIPEEVARTEIITEARSPLDNRPLTAAEYALLREEIATSPYPPEINPKIRQLIALRRLQKLIQIIIPFYR
ncbi:hypothetical protein V0288_18530 [Pannus brasiliensis CCIBt3594]|uniref:Glutathione S-transferase n=1 Tax=Pannus brasiliensis CCIBt3594 TaxID=1427578 RepID=A0AAW9QVD9_9CHRO